MNLKTKLKSFLEQGKLKSWYILAVLGCIVLLLFILIFISAQFSTESLNTPTCGQNFRPTAFPTSPNFTFARLGEFPWTAYIFCSNAFSTATPYIGSVLNRRWIVTSRTQTGDCLDQANANELALRMGTENAEGRMFDVELIVKHPSELILMIKTRGQIDLDYENVDPHGYRINGICVPGAGEQVPGMLAREFRLTTFQQRRLAVLDTLQNHATEECAGQSQALVGGNQEVKKKGKVKVEAKKRQIETPRLASICLDSLSDTFDQINISGSQLIKRQESGNYLLVNLYFSQNRPAGRNRSRLHFIEVSAYRIWMEDVISDNEEGVFSTISWALEGLSFPLFFVVHFYELLLAGFVYLMFKAWFVYQKLKISTSSKDEKTVEEATKLEEIEMTKEPKTEEKKSTESLERRKSGSKEMKSLEKSKEEAKKKSQKEGKSKEGKSKEGSAEQSKEKSDDNISHVYASFSTPNLASLTESMKSKDSKRTGSGSFESAEKKTEDKEKKKQEMKPKVVGSTIDKPLKKKRKSIIERPERSRVEKSKVKKKQKKPEQNLDTISAMFKM